MKSKIWLLQLPIIIFFSLCFYIVQQGEAGNLQSSFLRNKLFPPLRSIAGSLTNIKFKHFRGPEKPKNKIVIAAIDSESIESIGRWPWHRDATAYLVEKIFDAGAKVVGLDMVFSERDQRVPDELAELLRSKGMGNVIRNFETDDLMEATIARHRDQLVLGWTTESVCQPGYYSFENCPVTAPEAIQYHPKGFSKFGFREFIKPKKFDPQKTPLMSLVNFIPNLPRFEIMAKHSGTFNAYPDPDGYIRRTALFLMADGKPYPTLALEMARVGKKEDLSLELDQGLKVKKLQFLKSKKEIPVTPLGTMSINFRGPSFTFPHVSAIELMSDAQKIHIGPNRELASDKFSLLKDAYVIIGVTALGVHDMRAFPFDSNTAGVEGHANILDNLLSMDPLIPVTSGTGYIWIFLLMIAGALLFGYFTEKLESVPALILFATTIGGLGFFDVKVLFENNINWNTSFLYIELLSIFILTVAAKYILEEKDKKFIKSAFGKYVSPAMVDSIVNDPSKLSLGGEKRDLTILFSDIRGFTTLSEKMDAKHLSRFLNDYLGDMTDIIFQYKGTLDKFIGDAIMAFWGAPISQKEHGSNCCWAAIKMMKKLEEKREFFLKEYGVDVQIGIGINTGQVSVGNMGSEKNFNYTVIGDHVNLASRLEGLTKYYSSAIVTTRFTLDQMKNSGAEIPPHRTLDHVKVKGKKEAVEIVQILDQDLSPEGLQLFEKGRELYFNQQWDQAIETFRAAKEKLSNSTGTTDGPSQMYIERCEVFKKQPPDANWDGSWQMTSK